MGFASLNPSYKEEAGHHSRKAGGTPALRPEA
jgi:hypothetical protein